MSDKKWKPCRQMVRLLQVYISLGPNQIPTNVNLAKWAGVHRHTITRWFRRVPFLQWWDEQITKHLRGRIDRVWTAMYLQAINGDAAQAKLFIERFDREYKPTTKQEIAHSLPTVSIGDGSRVQGAVSRFEELRRTGVN